MERKVGSGTWAQSLSARRAWIEIWGENLTGAFRVVALRKESVDRNRISGVFASR